MCLKHPSYKVVRSPRTLCEDCWRLYSEKFPERRKLGNPPITDKKEENV